MKYVVVFIVEDLLSSAVRFRVRCPGTFCAAIVTKSSSQQFLNLTDGIRLRFDVFFSRREMTS